MQKISNKKIKIFIAITVIVLVGGVFWFFMPRDIETFKSLNPESQRDVGVPAGGESADMSETYTNPKYGFSFSYPKELNVSEFAEEGADVILAGGAFQLLISPFDEPGPMTKKRILKDIPDMIISNDKEILVSGEKALSFKSKDESGNETLEIWFVHPVRSKSPEATADPLANRTSNGVNSYLYQISALPDSASKLEEIIKTWKFQ